MHVLVGAFGCFLFFLVAGEAFEVMLLPRRVRRSLRFVRIFFRITWHTWSTVSKRISNQGLRDTFLSLYGPLSMIFLLSNWALLIILSLGLVQWTLHQNSAKPLTLTNALYFSGSSFFTVGYGDVLPTTRFSKMLSVFEAGTGLAFIAATIGYLPVLYQLFSQREGLVIQMDARAGSPPSAGGLLLRHAEGEALDDLQSFLRTWENWCAMLVESHLSYPMLSYYRSQHDNQSWLAALTTILDCCALILTGLSGVRTFSARIAFSMGRLAIVELHRVFHLKIRTKAIDRLNEADFELLRDMLEEAEVEFSNPESAQERLAAIRATYEPFLFSLSEHFLLPLPSWTSVDQLDNWQRSSRGRSAGRLVEEAPAEPV